MADEYLIQQNYGEAGQAVLACDLSLYLAVLLEVARVQEISFRERNVIASTAYTLADEATRARALERSERTPEDWESWLEPIREAGVARCLFRDACLVAWADGPPEPEEQVALARLGLALTLADEVQTAIREAVSTQEQARLRVLELLWQSP